jgi:hypothetical protein
MESVMKKIFKITLLFLFLFSINISAKVIYVYFNAYGANNGTSWDDAYTDVPTAVSNAVSGDEILVGYGTDDQLYSYGIPSHLEINNIELKITTASFHNDNSFATAQYNYNKVALTATGTNRLFYIHGSNVTTATVIRGFKLRNGNANTTTYYGGAIYISDGADPTITNCWIDGNMAGNSANCFGGGIAVKDASPVITNNLIENNVAYNNAGASDYNDGMGGGIYLNGGAGTIDNNTIRNNTARKSTIGPAYGGGICIIGNTANTISGNTIENNIASTGNTNGQGGGLYVGTTQNSWGNPGQTTTVTNNIFYNNTASSNAGTNVNDNSGGGLYSFRVEIIIKNNIFNHNTALSNSSDVANTAQGGGIWLPRGTVENNTFYENADISFSGGTGGKGSGCYFYYPPTSFKNNLFVNHSSSARPNSDGKAIVTADRQDLSVSYCGFYNNDTNFGGDATDGGNNITSNPQFTDAANGDFTLQYNSPCIDEGDGDYTYNENTNHDYGWRKDIGAKEYSGSRVVKSVSGTGELLFGGKVRAKINITTQGTLSSLDLTVHENETHANASNCVKRWYSITPTGSGFTCNVTLSYKDSELNGETEANLKMYRWNGSSWEGPKSPTGTSTSDNWLTCNGQSSFSDWILDADGALPVELTSFTADVIKNSVELNWQTATEVNNYGFEVQRSASSGQRSDWEKIGFVEGHGNSNSRKEYSFVDKNPQSGKVQFRLKQIDTDGRFEYSDIVEVNIDSLSKFELSQNYPNPFNPTTTIKYAIPKSVNGHQSLVRLSVYDVLGNEVATLVNKRQAPGNYSIKFDASKLSSGIYFYRLQNGSFVVTKKMILLR